MRFHQSWYRRTVLHLRAGQHPKNHKLYGSQLMEPDAAAGRNFLTPEIARVANRRLDEASGLIDRERLLCNMLSSQPMCFNLFGPLTERLDLATRLVRVLPGMPKELEVTAVDLEFAPDKAAHLQDATAFDAFIEYLVPNGQRGLVGVECKLTEPFSRAHYAFEERYRCWMLPDWWWAPGAEEDFSNVLFNQLWRNHLLAFSMLRQPGSRYDDASCAVVYHDEDASCARAIDTYGEMLRPEFKHTLLRWRLEELVSEWEQQLKSTEDQEWLAAFRLRYLSLSESDGAWQAFCLA